MLGKTILLGTLFGLGLVGSGCVVGDLEVEDRFCSAGFPCPDGYHCDQGKCKQGTGGGDTAPPLDISGDVPPGDEGPGKDTAQGDKGPAPDQSMDMSALDIKSDGCPAGTKICNNVCVDTLTNKDHCGDCNKACPAAISDRCENGNCHCGPGSPICNNGNNCSGAKCVCITGSKSLCSGCCKLGLCMAGTSITACGKGSSYCKTCSTSNPCRTPICTATGSCSYTLKATGFPCTTSTSGKCLNGNCCIGCLYGTSCYAGTAQTLCGKYGNPCQNCASTGKNCLTNGICN